MTLAQFATFSGGPPMADYSRIELGDRLRAFIKRSGKTQRQIADEVGIPQQSYLSHMANGRVNWVESEYFPKLAEALKLSQTEVLELRPDMVVINELPVTEFDATRYVQVRIDLLMSGKVTGMFSDNSIQISVPRELARRALGGLVMDRVYVEGIPAGHYALWSDRTPAPGELVIVLKGEKQYPAFFLGDGLVEMDHVIDNDTPKRFRAEKIIGTVEEIRMLGIPKRPLS